MTITVNVTAPDNKVARVVRSDGVTFDVAPGNTYQAVVFDDLSLTITEVAVEDGGTVASADGGGTGNGPPPSKS